MNSQRSRQTMSVSHEEYQQQQQQQRPRRSRPQHMEKMAGPSSVVVDPIRLSPEPTTTEDAAAAGIFDFFYQLIFSLVHIALTVVLSPVLGKDQKKQRQRSKSKSCAASESSSQQSLPSPNPPMMDDPECGMSVGSGSSNSSGSSSNSRSYSHHQPILRRSGGEPTSAEKKSVRFPAPERSRPPLGRFNVSSSSSVCSASSGSSSGSSSSKSRRDRSARMPSSRGKSPLGRLGGRRMNHSSYFLE